MSQRDHSITMDNTDRPSQRSYQSSKVSNQLSRSFGQYNTVPNTPTKFTLTPKQGLGSQQANSNAANAASNKQSISTAKVNKENNDPTRIDLCPWQIPTDPEDAEQDDAVSDTQDGEEVELKRNTSHRSFRDFLDDMKNLKEKRSQSLKKEGVSPITTPKSPRQKSKRGTSEAPRPTISERPASVALPVIERPARQRKKRVTSETLSVSERPERPASVAPERSRRVVEKQTVSRDRSPRQEKKVVKTVIKDLDIDDGANEKEAAEAKGPDNLFPEGSSNKEMTFKSTGPIRYSKMSEEDAATMFERRRRELLSFLIKLGTNSSVIKKKLAMKNIGLLRQEDIMGGNIENIDKGRVLKTLKGALEDNLSPNKFIVYNTEAELLWNSPNRGRGRNRFATPGRERRRNLTASVKPGRRSAPAHEGKRRNSARLDREREREEFPMVKRNLTTSFNQIALDGLELIESRSPIMKTKKNGDVSTKGGDEKRDTVESFTIDLAKICSKKKKKKGKKGKKAKEIFVEVLHLEKPKEKEKEKEKGKEKKKEKGTDKDKEKVNKTQTTNPELSTNEATDRLDDTPEKSGAYYQLIETMRQKSRMVLDEIEEIDMQIQRMKEDGKKGASQKKKREVIEKTKKIDENHKQVFMERLQEGYAYAAKMRSSHRSRSFSLNETMQDEQHENTKKNKRVAENKGEQKKQQQQQQNGRDNQAGKLRIEADNMSAVANSKFSSPTNMKSTKDNKTLPRVPSEVISSKVKSPTDNETKKRDKQDLSIKKTLTGDNTASKNLSKELITTTTTNKAKSNTDELDLKALLKGTFNFDQSLNAIKNKSSYNLNSGKNKSFHSSSQAELYRSQQVEQQPVEKEVKRVRSGASPLQMQSTRNVSTTSLKSPKQEPNANETKLFSSPANDVSRNKKVAPSVSSTKQPQTNSRKILNKTLSVTKNRKNSDKDNSSSEASETPDLFGHGSVTGTATASATTKTSFSDGVKKILREASKDQNESVGSNSTKSLNAIPSQQKLKRNESNRPNLETVKLIDVRAKVYKEGRNNHLELNKRDLKDIVLDNIGHVSAKKMLEDMRRSQNGSKKSIESQSSIAVNRYGNQATSLHDVCDDRTERSAGTESFESLEAKCMIRQTGKVKKQTIK